MKRRLESILVVLVALAVVGGLAWQSFGSDSGSEPTVGRSVDDIAQLDTEAVDSLPESGDANQDARSDAALSSSSDASQAEQAATDVDDTRIVYDWVVSVDELPDEAIDTLLLIESDGPYPYRKDGSVFQNREGLLPDHDRGYYREFTVDTPGSPDRGARRIVAGDQGELFYTADHYDSFAQIIGW